VNKPFKAVCVDRKATFDAEGVDLMTATKVTRCSMSNVQSSRADLRCFEGEIVRFKVR
jgi:hypothetical protein